MHLKSLFLSLLATSVALVAPAARAGILEDRAIESAIHNSYVFRQLLTDRSMVQVYVRYGGVELRGQVADEAERALLGHTVKAIPLVKSIDNNLFVDSPQKRDSNRWRAHRLRAFLLTHGEFDAGDTQIAYASGTWQVTGTVADSRQRELILEQIKVISGSEPLHTDLQIAAPAASAGVLDDPSVAAMVHCALAALPGIELPAHGVTSVQGNIVLSGTTPTLTEIAAATRLAAGVRGVRTVSNRMTPRG